MTARVLFLFAMFFGLAALPVKPLTACAPLPGTCHDCCAASAQSCCAISNTPASSTPAQANNASDEGRQLTAPSLIFLYLSPAPAAEAPAVHRERAAHRPSLPLLDLNCVRLI